MAQYMLLLHEDPSGFAQATPEEIQSVIGEYVAWREKLASEKRLVGGEKLKDEGGRHLVMRDSAVVVTDGPFAEAKEVLGGFFMIEASSYDQAVEIAKTCPHLKYHGRIELREVDSVH